MSEKRKKSRWIRIIAWTLTIPLVLIAVCIGLLYANQDKIVREVISTMNADFAGRVELRESHISLFANFPYISIDLEGLRVYENKDTAEAPVLDVSDVYVGFDLWTIIAGKMEIKSIKLKDGRIDLVLYPDGEYNVMKAFATTHEIEDVEEEFHLNLKRIQLDHVDISKHTLADSMTLDAYVVKATSKFKTDGNHILTGLDAEVELSLVQNGDTTFLKHKTIELDTELDYYSKEGILNIAPTKVLIEGAELNAQGAIDFNNDMDVNLRFDGSKPNFDLFIAMAPDDLIPTLQKYENAGDVFFEASISGPSSNGHMPLINARFGCKNAFVNNYKVNKKLDELNFSGFFTNGSARNTSTMEFRLEDFSARPEAGTFSGNLVVKNFDSPDINLQLNSDFQLDFLAKFFEIKNLEEFSGRIVLTMNFHDIIDLTQPERSIEKLNESYFTQLKIEDLNFQLSTYDLPVRDIDLYAELNGHEARIDYFRMKAGESDLDITGSVSDLPAILHHTDIPVTTSLKITSKRLNLYELTGSDSLKSFNEQIDNLSLDLHFNTSAKAMTESPNLPVGEFFIDKLYAKMNHYPHTLHDFSADVLIDKEDFRVIDFRGWIDESDFHFNGKLSHYDLWFMEHPEGDTRLEFALDSKLMQLKDIFSYRGANYVPEDYRHEEIRNMNIHGFTDLHFKEGLQSIDLMLDRFNGKLKIHPMALERFNGRVHYEDHHLIVEDFSGKIGKSDFKTTMHWYLGDDEALRKRDNHFALTSSRLDFDELFAWTPPPANSTAPVDHDTVFNFYELPFTHMTFDVKIDHLNYHKYLIHQFRMKMRTTPEHYLYIDEGHLEAADGAIDLTGYFNGSNPKKIYFSPDMRLTNVDLDKLMIKFDNFGQDHLVSENLHGRLTGRVTGKIHMHTDLVPKIDDSDMDIELEITDGRLERYALFDYMADYFSNKNLKSVRFDTLSNTLNFKQGVLTIPNMAINSSIGYMEISGTQDMNLNMDYYMRIPWKMVTEAASSKLFGRNKEEVPEDQVDEIQSADPNKRTRFVNVRVKGTPEDYKITLEKQKKERKK
ncbi:MAG: AsmA-like C-terminal region-containing protein [Flavobacteriales bacterium]